MGKLVIWYLHEDLETSDLSENCSDRNRVGALLIHAAYSKKPFRLSSFGTAP